MLQSTFIHISGLGPVRERRLWESGILSWTDLDQVAQSPLRPKALLRLQREIDDSRQQLADQNALHFFRRLPEAESWRMFPEFRESVAYLDIETTGLSPDQDIITTIVLYDGREIRHYVQGRNLGDFADDVAAYKVLVTYNGKLFDLPFIRRVLRAPVEQAHIDLRFVLASLGVKGGLKGCERRLGIDRKDMADLDGFFAVLLWRDYRRGNERALDTLLAYNAMDVVHLETLMHMAYNMKLRGTPFERIHRLHVPEIPEIPFVPHPPTIQRLRGLCSWRGY